MARGPAPLRVAVGGCVHGQLDAMYNAAKAEEQRMECRIDLLVCCGDLQAVRGADDLPSVAVPWKYRQEGEFPSYFRGEREAPIPTLVIGKVLSP